MKRLQLFLTIAFLNIYFFANICFSQSLGSLAVSDSVYAQFPRPNWDTLAKYSSNNTKLSDGSYGGTAGITMLNAPPIGDQGSEGSCVGWAVGYTAMGVLTYPKYYCWTSAKRSPNYVYNQIKVNSSCASGSYPKDAVNLVKSQGVCSWTVMPYIDGDCTTQPNTAQRNDAAQNKAYKWVALNKNDVTGIKQALDLGYPVINAFDVTSSFDNMWVTTGIWNTNTGSVRGGHATCIIGYDDSRQMFKVQNQWGSSGGDHGYYWVTYNLVQNNCLRELYILYGVSVSSPPSINGISPICSSQTFSINNLPPNNTVTWSASPANVINFSCTSCSQTTLSKVLNNTTTIQASITDDCTGTYTIITQKIQAGVPTTPSIASAAWDKICGSYLDAYSTHPFSASGYKWNYNGGFIQDGFSDEFYQAPMRSSVTVGQTYTNSLVVQARNASGLSGTSTQKLYTFGPVTSNCSGGGGGQLNVSPNPTTNSLTVSTKDNSKLTQLKLVDRMGVTRKTINLKASEKATINVSDLQNDIYHIQALINGKWTLITFIKE